MMKQLKFLPLLLLTAVCLSACRVPSLQRTVSGSNHIVREERPVAAIEAVEMRGFGTLVVTQGAEEALTIEAEDNLIPFLVTEMRGKTLVVRLKPLFSFKSDRPILFHLTVRSLHSLRLSGFAEAELNGLSAQDLELQLFDFTRCTLTGLDAQNFSARLSGFSRLDASGIVSRAAVEMKESAEYKHGGLSVR